MTSSWLPWKRRMELNLTCRMVQKMTSVLWITERTALWSSFSGSSSALQRILRSGKAVTASLVSYVGLRYDDGTPKQLSWAMRRTWLDNPCSERIVEDVMRYPLVIDKIVEHEGGVVPDFKMQHAGCSKRKRKVTEESRLYVPSPEVATVAAERRLVLREEASRQNKARKSTF